MAEQKSRAYRTVRAAERRDFPPFQKDTFASQLVWLVLIFAVLYLLMSRVALPRIGAIMDARRQERIEGDLAEAHRLKDESDAAIAAYEKALADARGRAQALANETRERYAAEAEAARKALDGDAQRPHHRGRADHRRHAAPRPWPMCRTSQPTPPRRSSNG